jgi:hypothetical protein
VQVFLGTYSVRNDRAMPREWQRFAVDPVAVGRSECDAWVGYYRRDWAQMLAGLLGMVRHGFAFGPFGNLKAAWHVLRGSQAWAPNPDNDPDAARRRMTRFFQMAKKAGRLGGDPRVAAELEVAWWHAHREHQHDPDVSEEDLVTALVHLYCHVYQADPADVRRAAELRVQAMALSDAWVAAGRRLDDPTLAQERLALVGSYTALREATDRATPKLPEPG